MRHLLEDLKHYLRWQVLHASAPLLTTAFVDENFRFFGTILTGAKEVRPRWKRCHSTARVRDRSCAPGRPATSRSMWPWLGNGHASSSVTAGLGSADNSYQWDSSTTR
jgi:hypothetical protein